MNVDSEQIALDKSLVIAQDQPLSRGELQSCIADVLGEQCKIVDLGRGKWIARHEYGGKVCHLLLRVCTYLGNPHPIFKKRVQFPLWFNEYVDDIKKSESSIDVRYIGVYHYGDAHHGDNIVFVDFKIDSYLAKKGHNSSAHIYTNDLFQAMTYGIFTKEDKYGNIITAVRRDKFRDYLSGRGADSSSLFDFFRQFNSGFSFGQWLSALNVIKEMQKNDWNQWRQAEWAGWFLEYKFNKFTVDQSVTEMMRYIGSSNKRKDELDFDIRFDRDNFYGDLKASDLNQKETPGNDQESLIECIYQYDRFWYVVYEHETIKDSEAGYEATKARNHFIKSVDPSYNKDEMSYASRMKNSVKFVKMSIIELNRINYREALTVFNQGHQPDGKARKHKFNINKKVLENDNYVVFRYAYNQK
ncbi:MAG: hypothetical protein ACI3Z0_02660 [Candidatus Cryptobacteroides sp.]